MKRNCSTAKNDDGLICSVCGNKERFIEVMAEETHLVSGAAARIHNFACRRTRSLDHPPCRARPV